MADSGGYRWGWSIAGHPTAGQLAEAAARYAARFGRFPSLLFVSPQLLADGIAAPLGVAVEADPHMSPGLLCFALPGDGGAVERLIDQGRGAAASSVFPVAFLASSGGGGIVINGAMVWVFGIIALVILLALKELIRAMRQGGGNGS